MKNLEKIYNETCKSVEKIDELLFMDTYVTYLASQLVTDLTVADVRPVIKHIKRSNPNADTQKAVERERETFTEN